MRVLHIIVGLDAGGAELMLKRLVEFALSDSSQQHVVVSLSGYGTLGQQLEVSGIKVFTLDMTSAFQLPGILWRLTKLIRVQRPDIVQTWMYHADFLGGVAARLAGVKRVIWGIRTTDVDSRNSRTTVLLRGICAVLSKFVPRLIVCAANASRRSHILAGYDAERMVVVPNGFDLSRFNVACSQRDTIREICGFDLAKVVIGYVGRFHQDKDQENFVCAAGLLAARHNNVCFLMVGRDLDGANVELREWILKTGYADRFILLGERADVPACLSSMDIFCLSSRTEGFPNVVGEAMATGLPCVVTDVGDAAFLVADTGIVVPKEDANALAIGMERLLALDLAERTHLGQLAKTRIFSEFSMQRSLERFTSLYQKLTDEGKV